jgi:hypothetical protein
VRFDLYVGIDYSGAETATSRLKGLQVYRASRYGMPEKVMPAGAQRNWTRQEIAEWMIEQAESGRHFIAGIDHAFSFPKSYLERYSLSSWDAFLRDFREHWPMQKPGVCVTSIRQSSSGLARTGTRKEFRLTDHWTSSAKSVFQFDVPGQVAPSTHAGLPWLLEIRERAGEKVFFWPFDGWEPPQDRAVIAEVYPSIFKDRYPNEKLTSHEQDAYAVAQWLSEMGERGFLDRYFRPPLTEDEKRLARLEGWILGIS